MKLLLITLLAACACADVSHLKEARKDERSAVIVKQDLDIGNEGQYRWAYETDNGISASQQGALTNPGGENPSQVVQGEARWTAPGGEAVQLTYTADENGYQPQGSHIPTAPPIPEAIVRSLEYLRAHPPPPEQ